MSYFNQQEVSNPMHQICWITKVSTHSITLSSLSVEILFTLQLFIGDFTNPTLRQIEGAIHKFKLLFMLEYRLCFSIWSESDK